MNLCPDPWGIFSMIDSLFSSQEWGASPKSSWQNIDWNKYIKYVLIEMEISVAKQAPNYC